MTLGRNVLGNTLLRTSVLEISRTTYLIVIELGLAFLYHMILENISDLRQRQHHSYVNLARKCKVGMWLMVNFFMMGLDFCIYSGDFVPNTLVFLF